MPDAAILETQALLASLDESLVRAYDTATAQLILASSHLLRQMYLDVKDASSLERVKHAKKNGLDKLAKLFAMYMLVVNMEAVARINGIMDGIASINYDQICDIVWGAVKIGIRRAVEPYKASRYTKRAYNRAASEGRLNEAIRREILRGIKAGDDPRRLELRIKRVVNRSRTSARTAARTETTRIVSISRLSAMHDAERRGVKMRKVWRHNPNTAHPRDWHETQDYEARPLNMPFSNGLMYPGQEGAPPEEVINCMCFLEAEIRL